MGLFDKRDKKRKDDFDSPVEQIDLSSISSQAKTPEPAPAAKGEPSLAARPEPAPSSASASAPASAPAAKAATPAKETRAVHPETDDYGIEKAIELMRTLPSENVELVVQVVKFSLESVGIKLPVIIEDAIRRQKDIQGRIGVLRTEIADLEAEIKTRKDEIDRLDSDHKETTMVRERLELAENIGKPKAAASASPSSSASATSPPPAADPLGGLPRVTRQTNPPPSSSPSGLPGVAPVKK